jgi:predicted RNA binding protein YcfA (HicA-like mRNA interferase family)
MARRQKRRQRIEQNPNAVRFTEIEVLLKAAGFQGEQGATSHIVYRHPSGRRVVLARPHGGEKFVKPVYVRAALAALEDVEQDR